MSADAVPPRQGQPVQPPPVIANPWQQLRRFTDARIALGRTGASLPTAAHLAFQLAHARARDAVHRALDVPALLASLRAADVVPPAGVIEPALESAAGDRPTYLQRPDVGRHLGEASRAALEATCGDRPDRYDLGFVLVDGLSALAIEQNAAPLLAATLAQLAGEGLSIAPLTLVLQGRVAIGDEVGERLGAEIVVVLIGERPGLSSPDSLGLYLTWQPRIGLTDAARNCVSNVRPAGLAFDEAAVKLGYLITEARRRRLSGVALKDETVTRPALTAGDRGNFLLDAPG